MRRAYSVLKIKAVDDRDDQDVVVIEGIATTPKTDRVGDIVRPEGAQYKTPMPFLWQHRSGEPVGNVTFAEPSADGIPFRAEIPRVKEPGLVKDRVDEALHSLQYNLVRAVSIGFNVLKYEVMKTGGWDIKEWEWLELSLVTIPMNDEAILTAIKSFDAVPPATGHSALPPAAAGEPKKGIKLVYPKK